MGARPVGHGASPRRRKSRHWLLMGGLWCPLSNCTKLHHGSTKTRAWSAAIGHGRVSIRQEIHDRARSDTDAASPLTRVPELAGPDRVPIKIEPLSKACATRTKPLARRPTGRRGNIIRKGLGRRRYPEHGVQCEPAECDRTPRSAHLGGPWRSSPPAP
jgi:hypothetical protein